MSNSDAWVKARLVTQGLMDGDTGAVRKARATYCRKCSAHIFRGLDSDFGSLSRDVDCRPLSRLGEALLLLDGGRSFTLRFAFDHYLIDIRDHFIIRAEPAGARDRCDVVAEHDCEKSALHRFGPTRIDNRSRGRPSTETEPPF